MTKKNKQTMGGGAHASLQDQLIAKRMATKEQLPAERIPQTQKFEQEKNDKPLIGEIFLPADTQALLKDWEPDNFALKLNRKVLFVSDKQNKPPKPALFKSKTKYNDAYNVDFIYKKNLVDSISDRHFEAIRSLGLILHCEPFMTDWRLIVGIGNESVYETSMTLHHVHGFPYIPGNAVKGIVRSWIINEIFGNVGSCPDELDYPLVNAEYRAYQDEGFCRLFGCPETTRKVVFVNGAPDKVNGNYRYETYETVFKKAHQGKVIFFDAYPISIPKIETDIMNPHFSDYYRDQAGKQSPADYLTPVPIPFLTVKATTFRFILGIRESENSVIPEGSLLERGIPLLDVAKQWLTNALSEHGIGAKTAVGYGLMSTSPKSQKITD
ncbi:MAG: type III-B CRISPR module RAMP protein Cmr6 [Chlorobiaceae bacterium]|nr:type III-B CRISPR module RAMP protein Cmr6 [Chlorobiaceae bacterium]